MIDWSNALSVALTGIILVFAVLIILSLCVTVVGKIYQRGQCLPDTEESFKSKKEGTKVSYQN